MKICLVADALQPSTGWGRYAAEIIRGLIDAGVECVIASPRKYCEYPDLAEHPDHHDIRSFMYEDRHYAKLLYRNTRALGRASAGCDLVHCFVEPYLPALGLLSRRTPLVASLVGSYSLLNVHPPPERFLLRRALRRAAHLVAISAYTEQRVREHLPLGEISVVPLGVRVEDFWLRRQLPARERKCVLSVGMVKRRKGLHVSIKAFARVIERHPSARYLIIGQIIEGPYFDELQRLVADLNLETSVEFLGEVSEDEKIDWYHRCTVMAAHFLSDERAFDGFGLVHLEANACGAPVIGTFDSGAEEPVIPGENGLLVKQHDVAASAAAIDHLLSNPAEARALGDGGRRRARQLTWDNTVRGMLDIFQRVVDKKSD